MDRVLKTRLWAQMLSQTRAFLDSSGFIEVTTPCLVPAGAFEASIDPLEVRFTGGHAQLHTSPEIEMKVLLAETQLPIYQITPSFRDDPASPIHRREFTMLEFYRLEPDCDSLIRQTRELFEMLAGEPLPFSVYSVDMLFQNLGLDLAGYPSPQSLRGKIDRLGLTATQENDSWSDLFFRVWIERVEPLFEPNKITVVKGYPSAVSPLTRPVAGSVFSERFEVYWQQMELCNGCSELADPVLLKSRWEAQNADRAARGATEHPFPDRLLLALEIGLPDCAGVAVGLDRLFLALAIHCRGHRGTHLL